MNKDIDNFFSLYKKNLYGLNKSFKFIDSKNNYFFGKISNVDKKGVLKIKKDDDSFEYYNFHEIKMIY